MLADRPQMTAFISPDDNLYRWAVHHFGRRLNGGKLYWSHLLTANSQYPADHVVPSVQTPGMIRINPLESTIDKRTGLRSALELRRSMSCTIWNQLVNSSGFGAMRPIVD